MKAVIFLYLAKLDGCMASATVTISRAEYDRLKKLEKVDRELLEQFMRSLEDAKHGRIRRVA